jgi:hypothetical protein
LARRYALSANSIPCATKWKGTCESAQPMRCWRQSVCAPSDSRERNARARARRRVAHGRDWSMSWSIRSFHRVLCAVWSEDDGLRRTIAGWWNRHRNPRCRCRISITTPLSPDCMPHVGTRARAEVPESSLMSGTGDSAMIVHEDQAMSAGQPVRAPASDPRGRRRSPRPAGFSAYTDGRSPPDPASTQHAGPSTNSRDLTTEASNEAAPHQV